MPTRREDLAWAAGFFDGEGCVRQRSTVSSGKRYFYPSIQITNTDRYLLERFRSIVGYGAIYENKVKSNPRASMRWILSIGKTSEVHEVISLLREWMGPKKLAQAEAALTMRAPEREVIEAP